MLLSEFQRLNYYLVLLMSYFRKKWLRGDLYRISYIAMPFLFTIMTPEKMINHKFIVEMSKKIKIPVPKAKPRNWFALSARLKKGGVHQTRCARNTEKQAWMRDWDEDLVIPPRTRTNMYQNRCARNTEKQAWMRDWYEDLVIPPRTRTNISK